MGNIFEITNDGYMKLKNLTSDPSGVEGEVIYNSTDKKLKYHDGVSWVDAGASALPWYMDATQYTVYDAFPTGTIDTGKWATPYTATSGAPTNTAQVSSSNSNNAGGTAYELYLSCSASEGGWGAGTAQAYIQSLTLPTGIKNMWMRVNFGCSIGTSGGSNAYFYLNGSGFTIGSQQAGGYTDIWVYESSGTWYIMFGGKQMGTSGSQPATIKFEVYASCSGASGSSGSAFIYVDDIRYN